MHFFQPCLLRNNLDELTRNPRVGQRLERGSQGEREQTEGGAGDSPVISRNTPQLDLMKNQGLNQLILMIATISLPR